MGKQTWLAIVDGSTGVVLDAYPNELPDYRKELGYRIISEHADEGAAMLVIKARMQTFVRLEESGR